jgi:CheY-like chemotaxis protein
MDKNGVIVVIEDDMDDQELLTMVFNHLECPNEIVFFQNGEDTIDYLMRPEVSPFLILCDINMPRMNGYELKKKACSMGTLRQKCVPFLFFSTSTSETQARDAYDQSVQGFFIKPTNFDELLATIKAILEYWRRCYSPVRPGSDIQNN